MDTMQNKSAPLLVLTVCTALTLQVSVVASECSRIRIMSRSISSQ